jgi:hypothetical protein
MALLQVGGAIGRALEASPWRVAIIASSSWSHSFLVRKHSLMFPDVEADKRYYEALRNGDWDLWRNTTIEEAEDRGHHELLNLVLPRRAMHELGRKKPDESVFLESWITNSDKVFAVFRPTAGKPAGKQVGGVSPDTRLTPRAGRNADCGCRFFLHSTARGRRLPAVSI